MAETFIYLLARKTKCAGLYTWHMTLIVNYCMLEAQMMFVGDGLGPNQHVKAGTKITLVYINILCKDAQNI